MTSAIDTSKFLDLTLGNVVTWVGIVSGVIVVFQRVKITLETVLERLKSVDKDLETLKEDRITAATRGERLDNYHRRIGVLEQGAESLSEVKSQVRIMWDFQMRRAISEVVEKGIAKMNSPLAFDVGVFERLGPIRDELISFYTLRDASHGDALLLLGIERQFGDRLLNLICVPCGLSHGACLLVALAVAKQTNMLELKL